MRNSTVNDWFRRAVGVVEIGLAIWLLVQASELTYLNLIAGIFAAGFLAHAAWSDLIVDWHRWQDFRHLDRTMRAIEK